MDLDYKNLPTNTTYKALPINNNGNFLKFNIDRTPRAVTKEQLHLNEYSIFDHQVLFRKSAGHSESYKLMFQIYIGVAGVFGLLFPLIGLSELEFIYFIILEFIALLFLVIAYLKHKKWKKTPTYDYTIYDRLNGEITLPDYDRAFHFKIPFEELKARIHKSGGGATISGAIAPYMLYYNLNVEGNRVVQWVNFVKGVIFEVPKENWSFFVWYMDKNRPLPPGSAFDEFREQDFERRKAEGFPPPLYKSVVPTIETTPEQQQEREKYWKDEDYMVDAKEAKYSLLDGFKDFKPKKNEKDQKKKKEKKKKYKKK